ncbi:MAG: Two-component transcriptional response regulator, LuxR family [uncultured Quadrisphaera sp.]|uniref:Two-component transcriptional response regulator, LuxR family n=1 Tax=uncultured Quadrisphaera sp. TaxID=904978 RepID=A0A6J4PGN4_9ACTN|nr:MAG: Two-component transcriptional response regulator, LuxR family [uncultured Quadrisphaera sp.]
MGGVDVITVGLVDDQELVRAGLAMVVDSQPDLRVVAQAGDGDEAVASPALRGADVVLMDVRMPRMSGIEATRQLVGDRPPGGPGPRVVVLTTFDLDEHVLDAVHAGASGFLLKDSPPEVLLDAIRTVHRGDAVIAPSTTRRLLAHVAPMLREAERTARRPVGSLPGSALDRLTEREREVLEQMALGLSNAEIAAHFVLSETTVKTHVGRVLAKLHCRDRVQAVVLAHRVGLVVPD